jgi:acid stress-induced BolA-like protein IbaG/YrbA
MTLFVSDIIAELEEVPRFKEIMDWEVRSRVEKYLQNMELSVDGDEKIFCAREVSKDFKEEMRKKKQQQRKTLKKSGMRTIHQYVLCFVEDKDKEAKKTIKCLFLAAGILGLLRLFPHRFPLPLDETVTSDLARHTWRRAIEHKHDNYHLEDLKTFKRMFDVVPYMFEDLKALKNKVIDATQLLVRKTLPLRANGGEKTDDYKRLELLLELCTGIKIIPRHKAVQGDYDLTDLSGVGEKRSSDEYCTEDYDEVESLYGDKYLDDEQQRNGVTKRKRSGSGASVPSKKSSVNSPDLSDVEAHLDKGNLHRDFELFLFHDLDDLGEQFT